MEKKTKKLLVVENLKLFYQMGNKVVRAVDNVSFEIEKPGESIAIVGESGCGKTSLALALLRLPPRNTAEFSGKVLLEGEDLLLLSEEEFRLRIRWKKIARVPQKIANSLNPVLKIGNQIEETLRVHGVKNPKEEVLRLLKIVGLSPDKAEAIPDRLSGGEAQRVCIAMALALKPALVILDEPTSALDPSLRGQIISLLVQLKRNFLSSYIFITHDIVQASSVCEYFIVFYAGKIVERGRRDDVLHSPLHPYTKRLLECILVFGKEKDFKYIPGEPPDLKVLPKGCRFWPRCAVAKSECQLQSPELLDRGNGHLVACHLI